ncbi:MAG: hypothetical protein ACRDFB_09170 [Rhabdochlamydiaceae bacterium]
MKQVKLSLEEWQVLRKLSNDQLRLLTTFKDRAEFQALISLSNLMIDIDKNYFFSENEAAITPNELALKHAYIRGAAGRGVQFIRIITAASQEILRREETARKAKAK